MIKHGHCPTCGTYTAESSYIDPLSIRQERRDYLTDAELAEEVRQALSEEHHLDLNKITVSVLNSVVTLSGEVPSKLHKRLAGEYAWSIPEVIDVANHLEIAAAKAKR